MRIIILGAGQVGISLARNLVNEDNDVVLVDNNLAHLNELKNRLDIQTINGSASNPTVLINAGIKQADLLIAVTPNDDTNMVACLIATKLFKVPKTIARIRSEEYYEYPALFQKSNIPIQILINPERLVTEYIIRLIEYPGISQLLYLSNDKSCVISIETQKSDWMNGQNIATIKQALNTIQISIVAIFNMKHIITLHDEYVLCPKDKILFITNEQDIDAILQTLERKKQPNQRITIAGGSIIGRKLAHNIQDHYKIKLIEKNPILAAEIATQLHNVIVLNGDIADRELLLSEHIQETDVFCAITDDDEANIMGSLQAKYLGAKYVMTLVNREAYVELIEDSLIDYALSPQMITIGTILSKLRRGNMVKIHRLQQEEAEIIELVVEGTEATSSLIGRPIHDIEFPPHCVLAGIIRDKHLHLNTSKLRVMAQDHVVLLVLNKKYIRQLEALFQVNLDFMS